MSDDDDMVAVLDGPAPFAEEGPTTTEGELAARLTYAEGLRMLAGLIEENPEFPLPYGAGSAEGNRLTFYELGTEAQAKQAMRVISKLVRGKKEKTFDDNYFRLRFSLSGLHAELTAFRKTMCRRVVVATETVTEKVPVYGDRVVLSVEERTREVETVKWVCDEGTILGDDS